MGKIEVNKVSIYDAEDLKSKGCTFGNIDYVDDEYKQFEIYIDDETGCIKSDISYDSMIRFISIEKNTIYVNQLKTKQKNISNKINSDRKKFEDDLVSMNFYKEAVSTARIHKLDVKNYIFGCGLEIYEDDYGKIFDELKITHSIKNINYAIVNNNINVAGFKHQLTNYAIYVYNKLCVISDLEFKNTLNSSGYKSYAADVKNIYSEFKDIFDRYVILLKKSK